MEFQGSPSFHQGAVASPLSPSLHLSLTSWPSLDGQALCCLLQPPKGTASSGKSFNGTASNFGPSLTTGHRAQRRADSTGHCCRSDPKSKRFTGPQSRQVSSAP